MTRPLLGHLRVKYLHHPSWLNIPLFPVILRFLMDIQATVTTSTGTDLKLTAKWPLVWLQVGGSTTIVRKLLPDEAEEEPGGAFQEMEIGGH